MTTDVLAAAAAVLCLAVAARSTWSPCGLSMLATIIPLAERGRGHRYGRSAMWFVAGGLAGGVTLGALAAALAAAVRALAPSSLSLAVLALGGAVITVAAELGLGGFRIPVHHRQVNERWLDQFRPWVYAGGFGWQVGTGLATYIMTPALYLMILLSVLTSAPWVALAVGALFGLARGLAVLLGRHLTDPASLAQFHRRFHDAEPKVRGILVTVEGAVTLACAWLVSPWAALVVAGMAAVLGATRFPGLRRATSGTG
jgi:cobalamin synthase